MSSVVPMLGFLQKMVGIKLGFDGEKNLNKGAAIRSLFKVNRKLAELYTSLLSLRVDTLLEEEHLPSIEECLESVDDIERLPLKSHTFASLCWNGQHLGILVVCHSLKGGGVFYEVTLMGRDDGIDLVICAEIRAARTQPEPFAAIFSSDGWTTVSRERISSIPELALMMRVIFSLHRWCYPKISMAELACANIGPHVPPKENRELLKLCVMAMQGNIQCTRVTVPLDAVVPNDISYALNYPLEEIRRLRDSHIDRGVARTALLLYQRGGELIMDDDYSAFLSYKSLSFKRVPAVILGKFNTPNTEILETGGGEIIPPILVERRPAPAPLTPEDDTQRLEWKLQFLKPNPPTISQTLSKVYFEFCHLLERRKKREADLHSFLLRHPVLLDAHAAGVHSEVRVGRYRADLILRYEQSDKRILLVELERDDDKIFKKNNRLMDKVAHASQQIEDWITMIRGNAPEMPAWLKGAYLPEGLVVIGRSTQLTIDQKEILFNINSNRLVKIVTYDDLLERLNRLIVSMEGS